MSSHQAPAAKALQKATTNGAPNVISLVSGSNGDARIAGGLPLFVEEFSYNPSLLGAVPARGAIYRNTIIDGKSLTGGEYELFEVNADGRFGVPSQKVFLDVAGKRRLVDDVYYVFPDDQRTVSPGGPFVALWVFPKLNGKAPEGAVRVVLRRSASLSEQAFETNGGAATIDLEHVGEGQVTIEVESAEGGKQQFTIPLPIKGAAKGIVTQVTYPAIAKSK